MSLVTFMNEFIAECMSLWHFHKKRLSSPFAALHKSKFQIKMLHWAEQLPFIEHDKRPISFPYETVCINAKIIKYCQNIYENAMWNYVYFGCDKRWQSICGGRHSVDLCQLQWSKLIWCTTKAKIRMFSIWIFWAAYQRKQLIWSYFCTWLWESAQELVSTRQFRADLSLILLFYITNILVDKSNFWCCQ